LQQLADCSAAITTEFENVPAPALRELAKMRHVSPGLMPWPLRKTARQRRRTS
jgi:5-(carboxyamino)imidazole ribonucleotide synthase